MRIIRTHEVDPFSFSGWDREQLYNGLDVCGTAEILPNLLFQLDPQTQAIYDHARELQGPVLEMGIRGCLIDQHRREEVINELIEQIDILESDLNRIVFEGVGMPVFNWRSPKDLRQLFYSELGLPQVRRGRSGPPTIDRAAREKLEAYPIACQLVKHINALAELGDKLSVLRTAIDDDGRIRTSYNIAGTSTGRFSSSLSEFGTGGNLQNIEESLRSILISDQGYKFAKFDAKSGESYIVGAIEWNLFGDGRFLNACDSGDVHTAVARLVWPKLKWTGDIKRDKHIAETPFYRHYTHRFMCKKIGHGSNYKGGAVEIASQTRLPIDKVASFQEKYFSEFGHEAWHNHVDQHLRKHGYITSLMGRRRHFWKRRNDPEVLKDAIAYDPQGSLADIVNRALLKLWRLDIATLMFQDHDALTFMYPEDREDEIVPILQREIVTPIQLYNGRILTIPYDCEVGWNKGKYDAKKNPDGLRGYNGHDTRRRSPPVGVMDRVIYRTDRKSRGSVDMEALVRDINAELGIGTKGLDANIKSDLSKSICDDNWASGNGEDADVAGAEEVGDDVAGVAPRPHLIDLRQLSRLP